MKRLAESDNKMLLSQDKGKAIVTMEQEKCTEKFLNLLNPNQFNKINHNATKTVENDIKRTLHMIKNKRSKQDYVQLYPTGLAPGNFYGTVKKQNIS